MAGCGSSSDDSSTSTASSPPATTAAAAPPTGEPILIGTMGEFDTGSTGGTKNPEWPGAVHARVKAINEAGGINGRPVEVVECNTALDPNKATACAREAVEKGVVAEIGVNTSEGPQVVPILEKAGIPIIGPVAVDLPMLTSKVSFPITSGVPGLFYGMPALLASQNATKTSLIYPNLPGAAVVTDLYKASVQAHGMTSTGEVAVPLTATNLTPSVASATKDGTDGIAGFLVGQAQGTLLTTIKQQGFEGPVATTSAFLTPQLLDSLGAQLDGVYAVSSTRPATSSSPGIDMFLADMKAYDSELPPTDGAINNWAATWLFERVVADLDEITAETVRAAIEQVTDMDMGGIVPPLTLTKPAETMPGVTRVFNPTVTFQTVEDGQLVLAGDEADPFVDPFASASGS